jgi:hypothetical protein
VQKDTISVLFAIQSRSQCHLSFKFGFVAKMGNEPANKTPLKLKAKKKK